MKNPDSLTQRLKLIIKSALALAIGMPLAGAGIILCMSIVFMIPGLALIAFSGYPLKRVINTRLKQRLAWEQRDRPLFEDEEREKPWEMDD